MQLQGLLSINEAKGGGVVLRGTKSRWRRNTHKHRGVGTAHRARQQLAQKQIKDGMDSTFILVSSQGGSKKYTNVI